MRVSKYKDAPMTSSSCTQNWLILSRRMVKINSHSKLGEGFPVISVVERVGGKSKLMARERKKTRGSGADCGSL